MFTDPLKISLKRELVAQLHPLLKTCFENLVSMRSSTIKDDHAFKTQVILPTFSNVLAQHGRFVKSLPHFEEGFSNIFYYLREELVVFLNETLLLVDDFHTKFSKTLLEGFRRYMM